ncbi:hypothetical protein A3731_19280 [Roseovarius sp. HI0049]|nr:hypothetical protein A3731_19280 [Roseovarius sp. HI0049]
MIEIGHTPAKRLVTIRVSGKLTSKEYDTAVPEIEQAIEQSDGKLNAVVELDDMRGWDIAALWKDLKFDARHFDDFRRIAVVGASGGEKLSSKAAGALTSADVEFFLRDQVDKAEDWAAAD